MACRLIDDADEATLQIVAQKLSQCADAPPDVLRRIQARGGAAAQEVLTNNRQIPWTELRQIAASGPCDQACALAARADLDREITALLAGRPEREVARALAANAAAPLAVEDLRLLISRGREDLDLARALLARGEPEPRSPAALSRRRRRPARRAAAHRPAGGRGRARPPRCDGGARRRGLRAAGRRRAAPEARRLRAAARRDHRLDPLCARRIVEEESGDALTIAFIAMGLPREIAARIFLIAFPKVAMESAAFERNMKLYESLPRRDAARVIGAVSGDSRLAAALTRQQGQRAAPAHRITNAEPESSKDLRDYLAARGAAKT